MSSKKELINQLENLEKSIDSLSKQNDTYNTKFATLTDLNRKLNLKIVKLKQNILANSVDDSKDDDMLSIQNGSIYNQIQSLTLPEDIRWSYWIMINQLTKYWVNRWMNWTNNNFKLSKLKVYTTLYVGVMFGVCGFNKKTKESYYVSVGSDGKINGSKIDPLFFTDKTFIQSSDRTWKLNDKYETKDLTSDHEEGDLKIYSFQTGNLGIFVWYMKDLANLLLLEQILLCNTSLLDTEFIWILHSFANAKKEFKYISNPFKNIKFKIGMSAQQSKATMENEIFKVSKDMVPHIDTLINAIRFWKENIFNKYGIKITSAKQQSLSSDANLSVSFSSTIAKEYDMRAEEFLKELGITIEVDEEEQIIPLNENADQHGKAETNTEAYGNERRSE